MTGLRYRIVTHQGDTEHVGSVVHGPAEILESLDAETLLHRAAGWRVEWFHHDQDAFPSLYCDNGRTTRRIYARSFTPTTDTEVSA